MLTTLLRHSLRLSCGLAGPRRLARRTRARSVAVVMYHGVTADPLPFFNWCQLDVEQFEEQVRLLAENYTVLPLHEVIDRLERRRPLPEHTAVLTFDDGFRNVLTTAYPVLERYQVPATVFLVTGLVGTHQPAWTDQLYHALASTPVPSVRCGGDDWPLTTPAQRSSTHRALCRRLKTVPVATKETQLAELFRQLGGQPEVPADSPLATMNWEEVDRFRQTGLVDFGSHTHTHPILSMCPPEVQYEELQTSRDILQERLGSADLFAYPNGTQADFTPLTQKFLGELGYRCGVSTIPGLNRVGEDLFALRRVNVGADTTLAQFEVQMIGL